jgi:hypothetical protein
MADFLPPLDDSSSKKHLLAPAIETESNINSFIDSVEDMTDEELLIFYGEEPKLKMEEEDNNDDDKEVEEDDDDDDDDIGGNNGGASDKSDDDDDVTLAAKWCKKESGSSGTKDLDQFSIGSPSVQYDLVSLVQLVQNVVVMFDTFLK